MKYLYHFAFLACISFTLFTSCSKDDVNKKNDDKENPNEDPCVKLSKFKIEPVTPVLLGEKIQIFCDNIPGADYIWSGPGFSSYDQNPVISYSASLFSQGWYYVSVSSNSCTTKKDSVYVDVNFPQGTPDCELTNNQVSIDGIFPKQGGGIRSYGPSAFGYEIQAGSYYLDIYMRMSDYWANNELEEGIYYTTYEPAPQEENKINIRIVTSNMTYVGVENNPVYISRVGGKLRVSLCLPIIDTHGYSLKSTLKGQFTED